MDKISLKYRYVKHRPSSPLDRVATPMLLHHWLPESKEMRNFFSFLCRKKYATIRPPRSMNKMGDDGDIVVPNKVSNTHAPTKIKKESKSIHHSCFDKASCSFLSILYPFCEFILFAHNAEISGGYKTSAGLNCYAFLLRIYD